MIFVTVSRAGGKGTILWFGTSQVQAGRVGKSLRELPGSAVAWLESDGCRDLVELKQGC